MEKQAVGESQDVVKETFEAELRVKNCMIDIKKALERWNCRLNPIVQISGNGIRPDFSIVPMKNI